MNYTEEKSQAGEYLRMALNYISKYNLSVNPVNYTVWYEYVAGKNLKLKKAMEPLVKSEKPISAKQVEALYEKYVADGDRLLISRLLTKISLMIKDISSHVAETEGDLAGHGKNLGNLAEQVNAAKSVSEIRMVVEQMLEETKSLRQSGTRLQNRMKISSDDLKQLQQDLEKSQQEAQTDALTGLINRRGLEKKLELERIRSKQNNAPFSVIMADLDHFKRVNDSFGHLVGDSLLKSIANILKSHIRKNDIAARYGGEEFLLLLPETNIQGAVAVCEKIRKTLSTKEWKIKESGKSMGKITLSMGVGLYRLNESEEKLIQRADDALYQAKKTGRDRVLTEADLPGAGRE